MALTDIEAGRLADNVFNVVGANKNLIINGAMQVYQRSGVSTNIVGYHLDRWEMGASGGARNTTQESLSSGDPYTEGFRSFHRLTNTTGSSSTSSYRLITQYIEAQNLANSGWNYTSSTSYVTLSFWVRASIAQTYYIKLKTPDGTQQGYGSAFSVAADTWTKVTKTIPGNSNITINNDNGRGMEVSFVPYYNTDYTDSGFTTDAWGTYSASSQLPDMTTTWGTTDGATFDITGVQLEVGSVATPFEHRSYGDELARCQRYYYKIQPGTSHSFGLSFNRSTTLCQAFASFPVTMRTDPTAIETSGTASDYQVFYLASAAECSVVPFLDYADTAGSDFYFQVASGLTAGQGSKAVAKTADAYLAWSAEL